MMAETLTKSLDETSIAGILSVPGMTKGKADYLRPQDPIAQPNISIATIIELALGNEISVLKSRIAAWDEIHRVNSIASQEDGSGGYGQEQVNAYNQFFYDVAKEALATGGFYPQAVEEMGATLRLPIEFGQINGALYKSQRLISNQRISQGEKENRRIEAGKAIAQTFFTAPKELLPNLFARIKFKSSYEPLPLSMTTPLMEPR